MSIRPLYPRELVIGADCVLRLYAEYHRPVDDTASTRDPAMSLFQTIELERVVAAVRQEYPNALLRCEDAPPVEAEAKAEAEMAPLDPALARRCAQTRTLLERRRPLFDGYFSAAGIACRVELLLPGDADRWDIVLIRSGTGLRGSYFTEAAVIRHCLEQSGMLLGETYVYYLNKDYAGELPGGNGSAHPELIRRSRIGTKLRKMKLDVPGLLARARETLMMPPSILNDSSMACGGGHQCRVCRRFDATLPLHNVYTLHRGGTQVRALVARGVRDIAEIDSPDGLTAKQQVQWRAVVDGELQVDREAVAGFLDQASFPLAFLDFEAYQLAMPAYPGVAPWQHMPFQFSLHVLGEAEARAISEAEPSWHSFIASDGGDARAELVSELLRVLPAQGSIFVYGADFERGVLSALAEQFPEHATGLAATRERIVDMAEPFREFAVYHPEQLGKTSLKRVLPLITGRSYYNLPLADGMQASLAYYFLRRGQVPRQFGAERSEVRSRLENYCGLDTYGLFLLWRELQHQLKSASISFR